MEIISKRMAQNEFKEKMKEIFANNEDACSAFEEGTNLMCETLKKLGYEEGVKIFDECTELK